MPSEPRVPVTRVEAAEALGYSPSSLATLMSRHPDRWPAPIGKRRVGRVDQLLWDLAELRKAAGAGAGRARLGAGATVSDADGLIVCAECGRRFRSLGAHLARAHGMTGVEYRERHGLPVTAALASDATRRRQQEAAIARRDAGDLEYLAEWQEPERLRGMMAPGDPSAASREHERVRENRRPGQEQAVRAMVSARRAKLDAAARERGYTGVADAVEQTLGLSAAAAARATGLSAQTIRRRRAGRLPRNGEAPPPPRG